MTLHCIEEHQMKRAGLVALLIGMSAPLRAQTPRTLSPNDQRARDIFEQLININTTGSSGSTTIASQAMADWLLKAGVPAADVQVIGPADSRNHNLVARFRGTGRGAQKPILLLAHLDVVEARREDWSVDPFTLLERDGFFYGRGTLDVKDGAAILVATLARLKQEGYRPTRDLILALTTGEEGGSDYNGVQWLLANHRDLIDAAYVINMDAGDPVIMNGKRLFRSVQAAEKVYVTFKLEVHNPGGHSSLPTKDNAIYRLAAALGRLSAYDFPAQLNDITRASFAKWAQLQQGTLAADMAAVAQPTPDTAAIRRLSEASPLYNAQLRTTCVATELSGGHAENALPQTATATINCRMLPGTQQDDVQRTLTRVVADTAVQISVVQAAVPSPLAALRSDVMDAIERVTNRLWHIPVIPVMETGATDGLYLRNAGIPVYGVSGVFVDINDIRAHGRDERIGVQEYYDGAEYIYQLVKAVTGNGGR
jgi:acetylornithine deacetylase/succinyl-diaminopimelate desuccinylase-like protein